MVLVLFLLLPAVAWADGLLPPLTEAQTARTRKLLAEFKSNPKGPYLRIRWYCNDGSVHPPSPPPCASRGGGRQHAELSPAALVLARWNIDVGTVLAALSFDDFLDAKRDHHRLKQLVLEKYLLEVDDGWIYRRARYYRGARQAEDEDKAGRKLLVQLLSDPAWASRNYLLANLAVAVIPHGAGDSTVLKARSLAKVIADQDARFQPLRAKIHSLPGPEDQQAVERFLSDRAPPPAAAEQLKELAALLGRQYSTQNLTARLPAFQKRLAGSAHSGKLAELSAAMAQNRPEAAFSLGAALSAEILRQVTSGQDGRRNLDLLDLNAALQEHAFQAKPENGSRRRLVAGLLDQFRYAAGAGLLSLRQLEALAGETASLEKSSEVPAETYRRSIQYLARGTEWCRATVGAEFGPLLEHYEGIEAAAGGLTDHLLRGSAALALAGRLGMLLADANRAAGVRHSILGDSSGAPGLVGLNPGVAIGRLDVITRARPDLAFDPEGIYVIPETVSDLKPMAGILTLDSGNALSHTQLLAANLGIPNAAIPSSFLPRLNDYRKKEMFYAVTPRGIVVLREAASLSEEERRLFAEPSATARRRIDLDISRLNLAERRLLPLHQLRASEAGVTVGPKAANLGQLASYFPNQVAPGLVIPFGVYVEHVDRVLEAGSKTTLRQQITEACGQAERMRQSGAPAGEISKFIYPKLAALRRAIQVMPLLPAFEKELVERMQTVFGPEGSYGVFVRSDTNAEDLPEFTGAGLNLTMPNRVGRRDILQAVKDVWASPLTERAYDWRSQILRDNDRVYPSVAVMRAVPSDKSGVIATVNLDSGNMEEITVNVSEGVGAVVDGGVAESLLLTPDGGVRLLEQARTPYRRVLQAAGGLEKRPASGDDSVLAPDEIAQIRRMVAEVKSRYPPARSGAGQVLPWDIEFGFEKGLLRLFQIRPLVRYQELKTLEALGRLDAAAEPGRTVRLDERP